MSHDYPAITSTLAARAMIQDHDAIASATTDDLHHVVRFVSDGNLDATTGEGTSSVAADYYVSNIGLADLSALECVLVELASRSTNRARRHADVLLQSVQLNAAEIRSED